MRPKKINFFSPNELKEKRAKKQVAEPVLTLKGSISATGHLKLPAKAIQHLGIDPDSAGFLFGQGRKKDGNFFLLPTEKDNPQAFKLVRMGPAYGVNLKGIFQKLGYDFAGNQYPFSMKPFEHEGVKGFELQPEAEKPRSKRGSDDE
jgi:hypothetical protein